jgi:hypothetical protein
MRDYLRAVLIAPANLPRAEEAIAGFAGSPTPSRIF